MPPASLPPGEIDEVVDGVPRAGWESLRGARLFVTGGTGFFGAWLLESVLRADERFGLGLSAVVLSRDPDAFRARMPRLAGHPSLSLLRGDAAGFAFPSGAFTDVIHAAADADAALQAREPALTFQTALRGTSRVLEFAAQSGAKRLLFTSSGAIYGRQPLTVSHVGEDDPCFLDPAVPGAAYGEGKRVAELLCALAAGRGQGLQPKIARCFAFVGPLLPLDRQFAVGNFLRDGLEGRLLRVQGDGTPLRSYLYASDLAAWLWTILFEGRPLRPYNVGSEEAFPIAGIAAEVGRQFSPPSPVEIARQAVPGAVPERYVPSTARARNELGLRQRVPFAEGVRRTVAWARAAASSPAQEALA